MVSRLFIAYFILVSAGLDATARSAPAGVAVGAVAQRAAQRDDATREEGSSSKGPESARSRSKIRDRDGAFHVFG